MTQIDYGKFSCAACNREYSWKPDYAGRKVKCKCGNVLTAPMEAPVRPAEAEGGDDLLDGLYDLAEQEQQAAKNQAVETGLRCPGCQEDVPIGEVLCPSCGFNLKTGSKARAQKSTAAAAGSGLANPMLAYAGTNRRSAAQAASERANDIGGSYLTELYVPIAAVVAGLGANLLLYGYTAGAWRGLSYALPTMGLALLCNLVLCFVGVAIAGKTLELSFGAPGPAALKLVALCLLPPAIAAFIGNLVGPDSMFVRQVVAALLMTPLLVGGFIWLFQFAADEAWYCTIVIWLVNRWAVTFLVAGFLSGSFGGSGSMQTPASIRADEAAEAALERPNTTEARGWLNNSGNRMYSGETHDSSIKLMDSLYDAGAKRCTTLSSSGEGYALVVELPSKPAERKKVFDAIARFIHGSDRKIFDLPVDDGQRYYTFEFSPGM